MNYRTDLRSLPFTFGNDSLEEQKNDMDDGDDAAGNKDDVILYR